MKENTIVNIEDEKDHWLKVVGGVGDDMEVAKIWRMMEADIKSLPMV